MVRTGGDKYLQNLNAPRAEFYELSTDPGERHNRVGGPRAQAASMPLLSWLRQQWRANDTVPDAERRIVVDDHNIAQLRALGYVD